MEEKKEVTSKGKGRGRRRMPEGYVERRLAFKIEDMQRLAFLSQLEFLDKEDFDVSEVDRYSLVIRRLIAEEFNKKFQNGVIDEFSKRLGSDTQ